MKTLRLIPIHTETPPKLRDSKKKPVYSLLPNFDTAI